MLKGDSHLEKKSYEKSLQKDGTRNSIRNVSECLRPVFLEGVKKSEVKCKMRLEKDTETISGRALETMVRSLEFILSAMWKVFRK